MSDPNPAVVPQSLKEVAEFRRWVRERAQWIRDNDGAGSVPNRERMLKSWRLLRPKMMKRLGEKVAADLAIVLEYNRSEAVQQYIQAGMPISDAREQANLEWTLWEPEDEEQEQEA